MDIRSTWKEIIKEILISGVMAGAMDALRNGTKKAGDVAVEIIISKMDERRGEMMAFISGLSERDEKATENLLRRQRDRQFCHPRTYGERKAYLPGDEDHFVTLLTKLYISLDEEHEEGVRREVFVWLGRLSDEEFDATIEFLHHDIFIQWFKRSWVWIKNVGKKISSIDPQSPGLYQRTNERANQAAPGLHNLANRIRARYQRR